MDYEVTDNDIKDFYNYCSKLIDKFHSYQTMRQANLSYQEALIIGLTTISAEHCVASLELLKMKHFSSGFALFRPAIETALRAYWSHHIFNKGAEREAINLIKYNRWPKLKYMIDNLDAPDKIQFEFINGKFNSIISGWVHGDYEQFHLRLEGETIGGKPPNHSLAIQMFFMTYTYLNTIKLMFITLGFENHMYELLLARKKLIQLSDKYLPGMFENNNYEY